MPDMTMDQMVEVMTARQRVLADELAPRQEEFDRITRALNALDGTAPVRRARTPRASGGGGGKRADDALNVVRAHPGSTVAEIAEHMGVKPNYLYRIMPALVEEGKVRKDGKGYFVV